MLNVSAVGPRKCRTQAQMAERESKKAASAEANVIMSNRQSWALPAGEHKSRLIDDALKDKQG